MSHSLYGECDLDPKEQTRLQVLNSLLAEHMTLDQAATLMGVSPRHTRRVLAAYREKGATAVAHGHRGRKPLNSTPEPLTAAVVHLARTRYARANHTHLCELLGERDGIDIGRTTLRRILVNAGLGSPRRRRVYHCTCYERILGSHRPCRLAHPTYFPTWIIGRCRPAWDYLVMRPLGFSPLNRLWDVPLSTRAHPNLAGK